MNKTIPAAEMDRESAWAPLRIPLFRALWLATLASNIGTWMHDVGAGWLMTSLSPSPVMVALVQAATTLPVFLLALPAGALADIVDRRRYLIGVQIWMAIIAVLLAWCAFTQLMTPLLLVALTFAMGIGAAMMMPAWASVTPEVVSRRSLQPAIALNSMGINIARAVGPAIAGVIISFAGTAAVFAINALSFFGVIFVLWRWQRVVSSSELPTERFFGAMRAGVRFARHAPELQAAVVRGVGFFFFASASWALLPLVARNLAGGGPQSFGILVGSVGAGAVLGATVLPNIRAKVSRDILVAAASALYAGAVMALSFFDGLLLLAAAAAVSGIAWIAVLSSLQVAAQMALPNWVRSRGLAVFMTAFMGSMAAGSLLWGTVAQSYDIPFALMSAALGLLLTIALTWRWKLNGVDDLDLTPSMHWPAPSAHASITHDRGPVLVTIEYRVRAEQIPLFLKLVHQLAKERRRDGAFSWSIFEHTEHPNCFIETFHVESWLEHLRQHERVTSADRTIQQAIAPLLMPGSRPAVNHYVAANTHSREMLS